MIYGRIFSKRAFSTNTVDIRLVKELRKLTGAPIVDCKKALKETDGNEDLNLAVEWLRKKGISLAAKKQDRIANEGLVGLLEKDNTIAMLELRSETDFVARNASFQDMVLKVLNVIQVNKLLGPAEVLLFNEEEMKNEIIQLSAKMGEKIELKSSYFADYSANSDTCFIGTYFHSKLGSNCANRVAYVVLQVDSTDNVLEESSKVEIQKLANEIALQIVGGSCQFISKLSEEFITKEKNIEREALLETTDNKKLSEEVLLKRINKKVDKKLKTLEKDIILMNQTLITGTDTVKNLLTQISKKIGNKVEIKKVVRYEVSGENREIN